MLEPGEDGGGLVVKAQLSPTKRYKVFRKLCRQKPSFRLDSSFYSRNLELNT